MLAARICFIVTKVGHREGAGLDPVLHPVHLEACWTHNVKYMRHGYQSSQWPATFNELHKLQSAWMRLSGKYAADRPSLRVGRLLARMFALFALGLPQWH